MRSLYGFLGYVSVFTMVLLLLPLPLRILNKKLFHGNKSVNKVIRTLKKYHRPLGTVLLLVSIAHGYLIMGGFRLHTGSILYLAIVLSALSGMIFYKKKKKHWLQIHKFLCVLTVLLLGVHYFFPSALYYLLNR